MAGQLRACAALSSSPIYYNQCTIKAQAFCSSAFTPLWSSRLALRLPSPVSCCPFACGLPKSVSCRPEVQVRSSFWNTSTFRRADWIHGSILSPRNGRRVNRNAGVARAAGPAGTGIKKSPRGGVVPTKPGQFLLIGLAVFYMTVIVLIPFINVFVQAFSQGIQPFISNLLDPDFQHAVKMTLTIAGIVVPLNTMFGLVIALWVTRHDFPFKVLLLSFLDLPFSISPVVVGLMLMLLYGREGVFAPWLRAWNFEVVFALPGMILATCFVTLPFVVREVIPVLLEMDPSEEEAARTMGASEWEVFWQVTFPNIRLGLLYGITLCNARAMGEFGALSVISGNIIGKTQTLTLYVESAYKEYNTQGAFSAALLLSIFAGITLFIKTKLEEERAKQMSFR